MSTGLGAGRSLERDSCRTVVRWTARVSFALLSTTMRPAPVYAQEHVALPPVNLGGSSFMDGFGGPASSKVAAMLRTRSRASRTAACASAVLPSM
jgi:hypothetical protein